MHASVSKALPINYSSNTFVIVFGKWLLVVVCQLNRTMVLLCCLSWIKLARVWHSKLWFVCTVQCHMGCVILTSPVVEWHVPEAWSHTGSSSDSSLLFQPLPAAPHPEVCSCALSDPFGALKSTLLSKSKQVASFPLHPTLVKSCKLDVTMVETSSSWLVARL